MFQKEVIYNCLFFLHEKQISKVCVCVFIIEGDLSMP
jgi:hypothetical protein